ncbi:Putative peptidyl-dipeptidase [Rhodobacterales bacterium HTCC2150]|nr:Putative peptidyl-dipeptidase [Rhodobacterales bacterium HTCC2150] [Rhodobacteraceae bacterium HTCC2150]
MSNPLLTPWTNDFAFPPFDLIKDEHFAEALDVKLANAREKLVSIRENTDAPTFENTIEALETLGEGVGRVLRIFFTLAGSDSNPKREELQREFSPLMAAFSAEVDMDPVIFARVDTVFKERENLDLSPEALRVLELTHKGLVRAGAQLSGTEFDRLKEVKARLAILGTSFTQNLLADEREWYMELGADDLVGLPEFAITAAKAAAVANGQGEYGITLSRSLIVPFLQFSERRDLREIAYEAWTSRGANGGETDNRELAAETLALRHERAQLLGYNTFADFKLETEMAKTPDAVADLLTAVWTPAKAAADADADILQKMMAKDGINGPLQPWDWRFYSEKRRLAEHDLDEAALKPYFQLDNMVAAAFDCAQRLFGLEFSEIKPPLYNPDVRAWDVTRKGAHQAVLVADYFARSGKRSGAWCSAMRMQQKLAGNIRPIVHNVCNFAKPAESEPALLSYDDARTLFHEFGHALHQMLSDVTYSSVAGTSVARDFVELPSQLFEHWLEVPEILKKHAIHAKTGEAIPREVLDRLLAAQNYDAGFNTVEYVSSAMVDLAFHRSEPTTDPMAMQDQVLAALEMPSAIRMRHATPHFAHVFAGDGYSSGYYSYMWSEVMDTDAFAAFTEVGDPFDEAVAARLEKFILSAGGSQDAEALYLAFRGQMPKVDALLAGRGLL